MHGIADWLLSNDFPATRLGWFDASSVEGLAEKGADAADLTDAQVRAALKTAVARYERPSGEELEGPVPLTRPISPATDYPVAELGKVLSAAALGIHARTQAPMPICANSTLAAAVFAVQGHADVQLPTGGISPLSEFFISIAESGERKTASDDRATQAARDYEGELEGFYKDELGEFERTHAAWSKQRDQILADKRNVTKADKEAALKLLGPEPVGPLHPMILISDPTVEGLCRQFKDGRASQGMFSDEGGMIIGGFSMADENRLRTGAALSSWWDGKAVKRTRVGESSYALRGRRLSVHLLVQPLAANKVFGDAILRDQGVLSRILAVYPDNAIGKRLWKEVGEDDFASFGRTLARILRSSLPLTEGTRNELSPRLLKLDADARDLWIAFSDDVEMKMRDGGPLAAIRGLADKLAEHAARIAGTLTLIEDLSATEIPADKLASGINIVQYYAEEAIRIRELASVDSEIELARRLLNWLQRGWREASSTNTLIGLPEIYQFAPTLLTIATPQVELWRSWKSTAG